LFKKLKIYSVLEFHQPEEMAKLIDLNIPEDPMSLNELIKVFLINRWERGFTDF